MYHASNQNMKKVFYLIVAISLFQTSYSQHKKWRLVWADEFNYSGLPDSGKWFFETRGNSYGWGNNEKQFYTEKDSSNAYVSEGILKIKAIKKEMGGKQYTSARLSTDGKYDFKYGRVEVRAKLPIGRGAWPAIWMLGTNIRNTSWPECGEIDIMEQVGYEPDSIHGTVHTGAYNHVKGTQRGKTAFVEKPGHRFHVYGVQWTPEKVEFMLDGKTYFHFDNEHLTTAEWPFDQPFYIILNLAIGGNWGGAHGIDESIFPATMEIDYVRVYQQKKR
jgi:beta-glucanase (GH16 family)